MGHFPGYDNWLDNYGNPGIWPEYEPPDITEDLPEEAYAEGTGDHDMPENDWVLSEPVIVTQVLASLGRDAYKVRRVSGPDEILLTFVASGPMLVNNEYVGVGDNLVGYLGLIEDYHDKGGAIGVAVKTEPFKDEE